MPYETAWIVEDRVILLKSWGTITDEDLQSADEQLLMMIEQSESSTVHFFFELCEVDTEVTPTGVRHLNIPKHPKFGWFVVYGVHNSLLRSLVLFTAHFFKMNMHMVKNREQALAFIEGLDALIPR